MSIFNKAKTVIQDEVSGAIDSAKQRVQGEVGNAVNRINKLLGSTGTIPNTGREGYEELFYPLERMNESLRSDRTTYWLKIEIESQKGLDTLTRLSGGTSDLRNKVNAGITEKIIWLYLPQMQQADSVQYDDTPLGVFGGSMSDMIQNNSSGIMNALKDTTGETLNQLTSTTQDIMTGSSPSVGAIATAVGFAKDIPVIRQAADAVSFASGVTKDPHTVALFRGVNLRAHTFEFNMVPESEKEAIQIQRIVQVFREAMYPFSLDSGEAFGEGEGGVDLAYIFPNTFKISAMRWNPETGEFDDMRTQGLFYGDSKEGSLVLENVTVNFDPTSSLAARPGGHFPATTMSLGFKEVRTLKKQDIRKAYAGTGTSNPPSQSAAGPVEFLRSTIDRFS